ncbi:MAG: hypothetical protein JO287_19175 [Pseudonocardiales bacterium]|nr:hypothetical protein [Pseudonocardiales bacterium]
MVTHPRRLPLARQAYVGFPALPQQLMRIGAVITRPSHILSRLSGRG